MGSTCKLYPLLSAADVLNALDPPKPPPVAPWPALMDPLMPSKWRPLISWCAWFGGVASQIQQPPESNTHMDMQAFSSISVITPPWGSMAPTGGGGNTTGGSQGVTGPPGRWPPPPG